MFVDGGSPPLNLDNIHASIYILEYTDTCRWGLPNSTMHHFLNKFDTSIWRKGDILGVPCLTLPMYPKNTLISSNKLIY